MRRKIPEIEESLNLCEELEKNFVVIPLTKIERHFPAPRLSAYPNIPAYDLTRLKEWANEKGWKVIPEDTWSTKGNKVPGVRFSRSFEIDPIQNTTSHPPKKSDNVHYWYNKPVGIIGVGVVTGVLVLLVAYIIRTHLGISL